MDNTSVYGDAAVKDSAVIRDFARVYDDTMVRDNAVIKDSARICGRAVIVGKSVVSGDKTVDKNTVVADGYMIDNAVIREFAEYAGIKGVYDVMKNTGVPAWSTDMPPLDESLLGNHDTPDEDYEFM